MVTTVTRTIHRDGGAGIDYTSVNAWEDDLPVDLVAVDERHVGVCKIGHYEETTGTVVISGQTTDATRDIVLTVEAGGAVNDNVANPLRYDAANGVYIDRTSGNTTLRIGTSFVTIERIQIRASNVDSGGWVVESGTSVSNDTYRELILSVVNANGLRTRTQPGHKVINCLICVEPTVANGRTMLSAQHDDADFINNTVVMPSDNFWSDRNGITASNGAANIESCAVFGFDAGNNFTSVGSANGKNNASDQAITFGANNQASKVYADNFVAITAAGGLDFQTKAGADLVGNGAPNALTNDLDFYGTARDLVTPDIGAHELIAGQTVAVGQALETDSVFAVAAIKPIVETVGQALEADSALAAAAIKPIVVSVGQALETDSALAAAAIKPIVETVGQALELDNALAAAAVKPIVETVGQALAADNALAPAIVRTVPTSQALEADLAFPLVVAKVITVGQALEADLAFPLVTAKVITVGQALEADNALAAQAIKPIVETVGQALEADNALAAQAIKPIVVSVGQALAADSALAAAAIKPIVAIVGQALAIDSALPVSSDKPIIRPVGQAQEADSALAAQAIKPIVVSVGQALETDNAPAVIAIKPIFQAVGQALEVDETLEITCICTVHVGQALALDSAIAVAIMRSVRVDQAREFDRAFAVFWPGYNINVIWLAGSLERVYSLDGSRQRAITLSGSR